MLPHLETEVSCVALKHQYASTQTSTVLAWLLKGQISGCHPLESWFIRSEVILVQVAHRPHLEKRRPTRFPGPVHSWNGSVIHSVSNSQVPGGLRIWVRIITTFPYDLAGEVYLRFSSPTPSYYISLPEQDLPWHIQLPEVPQESHVQTSGSKTLYHCFCTRHNSSSLPTTAPYLRAPVPPTNLTSLQPYLRLGHLRLLIDVAPGSLSKKPSLHFLRFYHVHLAEK